MLPGMLVRINRLTTLADVNDNAVGAAMSRHRFLNVHAYKHYRNVIPERKVKYIIVLQNNLCSNVHAKLHLYDM